MTVQITVLSELCFRQMPLPYSEDDFLVALISTFNEGTEVLSVEGSVIAREEYSGLVQA